MRSGDIVKDKIIDIMVDRYKLKEVKHTSFFDFKRLKDGKYFAMEVEALPTLPYDLDVSKYRDVVVETLTSLSLHELVGKAYCRTDKSKMRYDFVIFEIKKHKIVSYKTFEVRGEGHRRPIFGKNDDDEDKEQNLIDTLYSDAIKEDLGTIMIDYYGDELKIRLVDAIDKIL